jgi:uncharacterized protein YfbU (UPF0304 family)
MNISDSEKLILHMLCDVHEALGIKNGMNPSFIRESVSGGHTWALKHKYSAIFDIENDKDETLKEVLDILDMWRMVEASIKELSTTELKQVQTDTGIIGKEARFEGFDGNHEGEHLAIATFLIDGMGRYQEFKGRNLNTVHTLPTYRRMLDVYRRNSGNALGTLTVD